MINKFIVLSVIALSSIALAQDKKNWDDLEYKDFAASKSFRQNSKVATQKVKNKKKNRQISSDEASTNLSADFKSGESFILIRNPEVLGLLEKNGFSLSSLISKESGPSLNLESLYKTSAPYKKIADTIRADLNELMKQEKSGVGMAFSKRIFDANWFSSPFAQFELVGVVNRIDRAVFDTKTCGETRLVYRLAYHSKTGNYSRLPVTFLVKFLNPATEGTSSGRAQNCAAAATKWNYPTDVSNNLQLTDWIVKQGPLAGLGGKNSSSIEFNLQAMRIPSKARPDLAGHATYLLRAFSWNPDGELVPKFLENTIDVQKIKLTPALKTEFIKQFEDRHFVNRLSEGILKLEDKYLATRVWSYSPYGIARKENRLFDQIITEDDLKNVNFNQSRYVKNATAAIMRLNDLSCVGCHQARAHAGFHFLGVDKASTHPMNSLLFEGSGHFELEKQRRTSFMRELNEGNIPNPSSDFSFSPGSDYDANEGGTFKNFKKAGRGHFCGFPNGPFEHWQCEAGLVCQNYDEGDKQKFLGKCFSQEAMAGDPVLIGTMKQADHQTDALQVTKTKFCGRLTPKYSFGIFDKSGGFPSGQCYRRNCNGLSSTDENEACADSAGAGFNECIASTRSGKISFSECLEKTGTHYGFARCSESRSCRNDFVCARSVKGEGYCTPSYFLFQVRLDGHIDPVKGL